MATKSEKKCGFTHEYILKRVNYNPETGVMTWNPKTADDCKLYKTWNAQYANKEGGYGKDKDGNPIRRTCNIDHYPMLVHRLVYFYMTGKWADGEIDHINGDFMDNSWKNLRVVTGQQNKWNRGPFRTNKLGVRGVWYNPKSEKYQAYIEVDGHKYNLGWFKDLDEAIDARKAAAVKYYGEYAYENREQVINAIQESTQGTSSPGSQNPSQLPSQD